jgi:wyosine [tRNA(Phe)-imidazoG37] synthetase (radical SAM superfamily)
VALSGNGEPTTSPQIGDVIELIGQQLDRVGRVGAVKVVLITNGSMMNKSFVKDALRALATLNGEVWFKLDAATADGLRRINGATATPEQHLERLAVASRLCATWIQTCMFGQAGSEPSAQDVDAYLQLLSELRRNETPPRGVLLYTLARPSLQPQGELLRALPQRWLETLARRIEALGYAVKVSA